MFLYPSRYLEIVQLEHIVSLSGGKDSTAMLLMMLEKGMPIDRIIFVDTTKEFPQMYDHLNKLDKYLVQYNLSIERVSFDFDYWFCEHIRKRGKRLGLRGYGWPNYKNRWCTTLKIQTFLKAAYSNTRNVTEYHGIAYDEWYRTKEEQKRRIRYPLVEWKVTEKDALQYCYNKGFDWGGLYKRFDRVSCWCCPLSRIKELKILFWKYPNLWEKLKEMDKKSCRKFKYKYSVADLEKKFLRERYPFLFG